MPDTNGVAVNRDILASRTSNFKQTPVVSCNIVALAMDVKLINRELTDNLRLIVKKEERSKAKNRMYLPWHVVSLISACLKV